MLDIKWIRENPKALVDALVKRGEEPEDAQAIVDDLIAKDEARRQHLVDLQKAQERRNAASKEIGNAMRDKDMALAERLKAEVGEIKSFIQGAEARSARSTRRSTTRWRSSPTCRSTTCRSARTSTTMSRSARSASRAASNCKPKEHFEIGEALGLMDFERAAKLSGARFTVLKGQLARLERALGQFMLDLHTTEHGYEEIQPPLMVRDEVMYGTGQACRSSKRICSSRRIRAAGSASSPPPKSR